MSTTTTGYNPTQTFEVEQYDLEYRRDEAGKSWQVHIYRPQGVGPFPTLLSIHGGAWSGGGRLNNPLINGHLAASGLLVAVIDTRLGPEYPYPGSVQDVNYATRWLKAHAGEHNGQTNGIGIIGISSGGHLAVLAGMRPHDPKYAALPLPEAPQLDATAGYVITCWGVIDPLARYKLVQEKGRADVVEKHEGYFLSEDNMREGNPQTLLDRGEKCELPPVLLVQGTADKMLPDGMAERFIESYRAAGGAIEPAFFEGMGHSFANEPGPETDRALETMKQFIARQVNG